jgi:PAS domain-containing protein
VSNFTAVRAFNQSTTDTIKLGKVDMLETDFGNPSVRLSRFINNAPIGIAEVDKEGGIRMANAAFIDLSQKVRRGAGWGMRGWRRGGRGEA